MELVHVVVVVVLAGVTNNELWTETTIARGITAHLWLRLLSNIVFQSYSYCNY